MLSHRILTLTLIISLYLGLSDGYLALWKAGNSKPEIIYPYHISLYPQIDQVRLKKGIPIRSTEELSQHIEDFLS